MRPCAARCQSRRTPEMQKALHKRATVQPGGKAAIAVVEEVQ